jgi:hypothetical protein
MADGFVAERTPLFIWVLKVAAPTIMLPELTERVNGVVWSGMLALLPDKTI